MDDERGRNTWDAFIRRLSIAGCPLEIAEDGTAVGRWLRKHDEQERALYERAIDSHAAGDIGDEALEAARGQYEAWKKNDETLADDLRALMQEHIG